MTPVDPAVIRRKLGLIINNLQALESIRDIAPVRYHGHYPFFTASLITS